ncbi:hypothetical protein FE257_002522 [Aspergillus nanangensis]|uniref:Uncharacterized protein n=1 Tax=Aspergillus nanangensis TaxID=2582783 RepID=A0AAD4CT68_ASPNN|nr:hypothetical protein FE257_002522 [Aspergillus nanangensis]
MVAIDTQFNGYRTVLLPWAYHHPDVRRAICIVSALHLGQKTPGLCEKAQRGRLRMITEFRHRAETDDWSEILVLSHWAVIILFLVAEMISGGDDFSYLVKMLLSLVDAIDAQITSAAPMAFLLQQTRMIQFFSCPFLGESEAINTLTKGVRFYSGWVSTVLEHYPDQIRQDMVFRIIRAMELASDIYLQQTLPGSLDQQFAGTSADIQLLKSLVEDVQCDTPGSPGFVWVYFIGVASSRTVDDREFFRRRLMGIHSQIGFNNITLGLSGLDRVCRDSGGRWTEMLPSVATLVM